MPAKRRDIAAESAASVASLQEFVKGFQAQQAKYLAITASPAIVSAALRRLGRKGRRG